MLALTRPLVVGPQHRLAERLLAPAELKANYQLEADQPRRQAELRQGRSENLSTKKLDWKGNGANRTVKEEKVWQGSTK